MELPPILLSALQKRLPKATVYVFAHLKPASHQSAFAHKPAIVSGEHIYAIVFSNNTNSHLPTLVSEDVMQASDGKLLVTILMHKPSAFKTKSGCMKWFFAQVLKSSSGIFWGDAAASYPVMSAKRNISGSKAYWHKCESVASVYFEAASESNQISIELVRIAMLHQAVEFAALGLIRVFLGYTPKAFSIGFLLDLCALFTDLGQDCFPSRNEQQIRCVNMLSAPIAMLRQWDRLEARQQDIDWLLERSKNFVEQSRHLAYAELDRLQNVEPKIFA